MVAIYTVVFCALVGFIICHPTMYKLKDNKVLEPDLVPVSSTVIPIPVYKVGYGLKVVPSSKGEKVVHPDGQTTLITAQNKKKYYTGEKPKSDGISTIKQVTE